MARLNYDIRVLQINGSGDNSSIRLDCLTNFGTHPQARIYLDGSSPPAFTNLVFYAPLSSQQYLLDEPPAGLYIVQFKNDEVGIITLAKVRIKNHADLCWPDVDQSIYILGVRDSLVQVGVLQNTASPISTLSQISIDEGATFKSVSNSAPTVSWTNSELVTLGLEFDILEVVFKRTSNSCQESLVQLWFVEQQEFPELEASGVSTNETAAENNDGTITLTVEGGSGSYEFEWADGPTTQNRVGLSSGTYSVIVTDIETEEEIELEFTITEPQPPVLPNGTVLEVPFLNSLYFVVEPIEPDGVSTFQGLDNVMLCKQRHGLFQEARYEQKVCRIDDPIVQFNSDFNSHEVLLLDVEGTVLASYPVVMVEENIGRSVTYPMSIQHDSTGKSRVYFAAGPPPISLEIGDTIEVLNNLDGFDGVYSIVDIRFDTLKSYSYLVINLVYDAPGATSSCMGRFLITLTNYNVYESKIVFATFDDGIYQVKIRAFDSSGGGQKVAYSEPIDLKEVHRDTLLWEYRNFDNADNMLWSLGYLGRKRIEGVIGHKRVPGGERSTTRNASYDLIKTSAKKTRGLAVEIIDIPPYLYEILCCITDLDFYMVNKVEYQTSEAFGEPQFQEKSLLYNASCKLEQPGWIRQYNNDDVGSTVVGTGVIASDGGFIKST